MPTASCWPHHHILMLPALERAEAGAAPTAARDRRPQHRPRPSASACGASSPVRATSSIRFLRCDVVAGAGAPASECPIRRASAGLTTCCVAGAGGSVSGLAASAADPFGARDAFCAQLDVTAHGRGHGRLVGRREHLDQLHVRERVLAQLLGRERGVGRPQEALDAPAQPGRDLQQQLVIGELPESAAPATGYSGSNPKRSRRPCGPSWTSCQSARHGETLNRFVRSRRSLRGRHQDRGRGGHPAGHRGGRWRREDNYPAGWRANFYPTGLNDSVVAPAYEPSVPL